MGYRLTIPVFTERMNPDEGSPEYVARPVFYAEFQRSDPRESRALSLLEGDLRRHLSIHGGEPDHYLPLAWSFSPELRGEKVKVLIDLRKSHRETHYFIVSFRAFDRWVCLCPKLPEVVFELHRGQNLPDRAAEVYSEHFRALEKRIEYFDTEDYATTGTARLSLIDVDCSRQQKIPDEERFRFSSLGGSEKMSGSTELERVGRNLNRLYPESLESAIFREAEITALTQTLIKPKRRRPVILVGPSRVGKTAIIHEFLRRYLTPPKAQADTRTRKPKKVKKSIRGVWLLDPQRLISGMAYVGQWEERFLAIVKEVRKRSHVIYIDDVIGFFQSGRTRDSDLCLGDLLKAQFEESPVNLLAETTPEGWRKLRELDRGFADLFKVIRVSEPSDADTIRIAIHTMRELEERTGTRFKPEVLPVTIDLQRRFVRGSAFPGKAAEFLRQLSTNFPKQTVDATRTRSYFQRKTGMATVFLDSESALDRQRLNTFFQSRIVAQSNAVTAMADAITLGKARLNDPGRPMASLLFLGPTGVGKTECAKALAEFVFGAPERVLRFDMNEFVGPDAAARLIGLQGQPRGLLTGAIRRQPFSVLLLDEVEKAHHSVFDLLLQVLGEGRLTDAGGQTADFCNAIIILTSNLGARDQSSQVGFGATADDPEVYTKAAEKFFRPEFFNRLDRVVPFHALSREHIAGMAERLARKALGRFGLSQRELMLELDPGIFDMLAERGFESESGARALRRAVEDHLVLPLSEILTQQPAGQLTSAEVSVGDDGKLQVRSSAFVAPDRIALRTPLAAGQIADLSDCVHTFLKRAGSELDAWEVGEDFGAKAHYYYLREELLELRRWRDGLLHRAEQELNPKNTNLTERTSRFGKRSTRLVVPESAYSDILETLSASGDPGKFLAELAAGAELFSTLSHHAENLICRANRLQFFLSHKSEPDAPQTIHFGGNHPLSSSLESGKIAATQERLLLRFGDIVNAYLTAFGTLPGGGATLEPEGSSFTDLATATVRTDIPLAGKFLAFEGGTHLVYGADGSTHNLHVSFSDSARSAPPQGQDEFTVLRVHHESGFTFDLRTGIITDSPKTSLWTFIDPHLPPADEFAHFPTAIL